MAADRFPRLEQRYFWLLVAISASAIAIGLGAAHVMEVNGHAVTGMSNQIVWGMPHVFAIFMIVTASGVLNVASIGSVFGKPIYKARAPLSGLLSLALLAGGLMVLMLDLGRPDRVIVAATHYNFKSIFAWNVFLYTGLFAVVGIYLWMLMERRMNRHAKVAGLIAFVWRFALTTGTGSIFGFLVARQAYQSAVLAPMFIVMSFAWGLAVFLIVQSSMYAWNRIELDPAIQRRMARLLGLFVVAVLYFVAVHHLTNLYFARQLPFERFILLDGGAYTVVFWVGYVLAGTAVPLALLFSGSEGGARSVTLAALLVVAGAFSLLYVFIIGGQAFPLDIFPGYATSSSFFDGAIDQYTPSLPEILLGLGGLGFAFLATTIGVRVLHFMPEDDFGSVRPLGPASSAGSRTQ
ncbi:MAG TPA: polysulfide reductase NrfD [Rhodocyclaceae bacterium]|nr:polysulfide reductase NrfD [Rhodocyclaceae bacterium]